MAEHPMETTLRTALWRQFGAAIDMLEHALVALPNDDSAVRARVMGSLAQEIYFAPGSRARRTGGPPPRP